MGVDDGDVVERGARRRHQVHHDVEHHLPLDQQVGVEGQGVERDVDRALDRVLDRREPQVDLAVLGGVEHVDEGAHREQLLVAQVGLGAKRLLGEGSLRAEIGDAAGRSPA